MEVYASETFWVECEDGEARRMVTPEGVKAFFRTIGTTPREMLDAENLKPFISDEMRGELERMDREITWQA